MGYYHNMTTASDDTAASGKRDEALQKLLSDAANDPSILLAAENVHFLVENIGKRILAVMLKNEQELFQLRAGTDGPRLTYGD